MSIGHVGIFILRRPHGACILVVEILGAKMLSPFLVRPILFGRRKLR